MNRLPDELIAKLQDVHSDLLAVVSEMRQELRSRSDTWRASPAGQAYAAWVNTIQKLTGDIADVPQSPDT